MIWLRRILVIPLGLLFFAVLLAALVILRINGTVFNPDFYADQFRKANIYHFAMNDLLVSALDEARAKDPEDLPGDFNENPVQSIDLTTEEIVAAANRAVPPQWIQAQVEEILDEVGKYASGQRDEFQFTIVAKDRVTDLVSETTDLFVKADTHDLLFDEVVEPEVDEALKDEGVLPLNVPLSSQQLVSSAQRVVPEDWVEEQVVNAIDEVTPYAVGDRDDFRLNVQLADRVDIALQEVKELLREADAYDLLYDEVIAPRMLESIGEGLDLPYGIQVSDEELLSAMREVAPVDWVQQQVDRVIDEAGPYLVGTEDALEITVDLRENKRDALVVIDRAVNERLTALVQGTPPCAEGQLPNVQGGLPTCLPLGLDILAAVVTFNLDITGPLAEAMDTVVPDAVTFTDADLRQALIEAGSEKNVDLLDQVREVLSQGWSYTDQELRQDLLDNIGEDSVRVLDDFRAALRDGWTYTDADYRQDLIDAGETDALDTVDDVRSALGDVRTFQWAPYLLAFFILVIIGFLGGRRWNSRVAWPAAVLTITSLIIFIAVGPVWSSAGSDRLEDQRIEALEDLDGTQRLAADKFITTGITAADDFFSGLGTLAMIAFIIGIVLLLLSLAWPTQWGTSIRRKLRLAKAAPPEQDNGPPPEAVPSAAPGEVPTDAGDGPSVEGDVASRSSAEPETDQRP
ncbi:MAG: hypothetical protein ACE5KI_02915 [Dehalococcoidia bacterium]